MTYTKLLEVSGLSDEEIKTRWEEAYTQFETSDEEIKKFTGRFRKLGERNWRRDAQIVDIFCGRGNGLVALEGLGFTRLEGVDISPELLARYSGKAVLYEADCRELPFEDDSRDIIIVQGGLHHLPRFPDDLDQTFSEICRVLRPTGRFIAVEPWLTPFLRLIHFISERKITRQVSNKFDAFATMTHYEAETYFRWLESPETILDLLKKHFEPIRLATKLGKLYFVGGPKPEHREDL